MNQDQTTEQAIQAAGADIAPRVTPADIEAEIASEHYFTAWEGAIEASRRDANSAVPVAAMQSLELLTFCVLVLRNGFTVTGESACASPENLNAEIGRRIARENAVAKVWPLLGFRLRDQLAAYSPAPDWPPIGWPADGAVLTEADALADLNGLPRPSPIPA